MARAPWVLLLPLCMCIQQRRWTMLCWFVFAILSCAGHSFWYKTNLIEPDPYKQHNVVGKVAERLSYQGQDQTIFILQQIDGRPTRARAWLSCYKGCRSLKVGQEYHFQAIVRKPHILRNPGNLHRFSIWQKWHIDVVIKLKSRPAMQAAKLDYRGSWRSIIQKYVARRLSAVPLSPVTKSITEALVIGDTHGLSKNVWDVFRLTGTTHLMVISGAHIGLLAAMLYGVFGWLWRRSARLCLLLTAPQAASIAAMSGSIFYAWLSGFAPPAERALLAVLFVLSRFWLGRKFSLLLAWRYALIAVLLFEPHAVLMPGFYLSFGAALILILSRLMVKRGVMHHLLLVQSMCLLGLTPLTLYFFGFGGLNGLVTNLFAIPWVGYGILPLGIVTVFLPAPFAYYCAIVLQKSVSALLAVLQYFAQYPVSLPVGEVSLHWLLAAYLLLSLSIVWRWYFARSLIAALAVILCFPFDTTNLGQGDVRVDVLDVGQGLAVGVHTKKHHLLFDTGGAWFGGDMGKLVVLPYLKTEGIRYLDKVIISHGDLDHRGGYETIKQYLPIGQLISNGLGRFASSPNCRDIPAWQWDHVDFRFLQAKTMFADSNNRSCVLKITAHGRSVLLTGDIERKAERALLKRYHQTLQADVLLLAHHASKTSSSDGFLRAVAPQYVIASYAYANSYRFPHPPVLERLRSAGLPLYNTADMGMIRVQNRAGKWTVTTVV